MVFVHFHFFEALNDVFQDQFFSGDHFYNISKTQITIGTLQLRCFKVKSLITNVFDLYIIIT